MIRTADAHSLRSRQPATEAGKVGAESFDLRGRRAFLEWTETTTKEAKLAQSAEDVARESIECYNAGDFDRLRSLLADDFYEEELATQRRLEGQTPGSRRRRPGSKRFRMSAAQ